MKVAELRKELKLAGVKGAVSKMRKAELEQLYAETSKEDTKLEVDLKKVKVEEVKPQLSKVDTKGLSDATLKVKVEEVKVDSKEEEVKVKSPKKKSKKVVIKEVEKE
jgi:hypothetical protein